MVRPPPPDGSRDPRIEDPTNRWIVHLAGRMLLPVALRLGVSANMVSVAGLLFGAAAGWAFLGWRDWRWALAGFLFSLCWLIADGLDGMIARATGTASAWGRILDGLCDHGVFAFLYVALAFSIGTPDAWALGVVAALAHGVQASLYEGERERFHRRLKGDPGTRRQTQSRNPLVHLHEAVATCLDGWAKPFDAMLRDESDPLRLGQAYGEAAARPLKTMWILSNNVRVIAILIACLAGNPRIFWWFELIPLSIVLAAGVFWHRHVEKRLVQQHKNSISTPRGVRSSAPRHQERHPL